mgnify:CR=1 FL=1
MHEMSLAQSIVEIVENTAQQNQAPSVVSVKLIVGELAGVEMHALMQGLKIASQGTVMQRLKLSARREQPGVSNVRKLFRFTAAGSRVPSAGAISSV